MLYSVPYDMLHLVMVSFVWLGIFLGSLSAGRLLLLLVIGRQEV